MKNKTTPRSLLITTAAGTITGGLVGMFASPIAYWMLGKKLDGSARWLAWAAIGLIGSPLSFFFSVAMIPPEPRPIAQSTPAPVLTPATPQKPAAVVPTPKPKPIALNVPRERLQSKFEEFGFTFEKSSAVQGQPRVLGRSANRLASLELIGAPENLTQVSMLVGMVNDSDESNMLSVTYLLLTLKTIAPAWDSTEWLTDGVHDLATTDRTEVVTVYGGKQFKLTMVKELSFLTLTVEPKK